MKSFLAPLLALLVLTAPALAQTRALPPGEIRANGEITFGNALKLGKREAGKTIITPDTLQILGSGSTGDLSSTSARPSDALAARSLAAWFGEEKNSAAFVQAGDTTPGQSINRAITAAGGSGRVRVPPGTYADPGEVRVFRVGRVNGADGHLVLDMRGVRFTGTCSVTIDSSKHVTLFGLDAKACPLNLRGVWNSRIADASFDTINFGDVAGTDYSSAYWNVFDNIATSAVRFNAETNANTFSNSRFRGDGQQGFATARGYTFEFNANANVQALNVIGGDVSYYAQGIYSIGSANTSADIDLTFDGKVYFDTVAAPPAAARPNVRVVNKDVFLAQPKALPSATLQAASKGDQVLWGNTITSGWRATADANFVPNGDLSSGRTPHTGTGRTIQNAGGATVTEQAGGVNGRYLNINQTTNGIVYIISNPLPVAGQYGGVIWARAPGGTGTSSVQFGFDGQFVAQTLGADWTFVGFSPNAQKAAGSTFNMTINKPDGTPWSIDVMYAGVTLGNRPPLFARSLAPPPLQGTYAVPAQTLQPNTFSGVYFISVPGSKVGDFVDVSYDKPLSIMRLLGTIEADGQVQCIINNPYGNARSIEAGTITARVTPRVP